MADDFNYSIADVLAIAKIHPFYEPSIAYPPDAGSVLISRERSARETIKPSLAAQPLLRKKDLYTTIERLINDTSSKNAYRQSTYASVTGGGFGAKPLFFATDVHENRRHRAQFGDFLRTTGVITPGDWVVTVHTSGELYRSLDLMLELMENAGASVLGAGNMMSPPDVVRTLLDYHVNVLSGDCSQIVRIVHHISKMAPEDREKLKLNKIIYTSETLTDAQRALIINVLGSVQICSVMGSAEAGPYAVSNPDLTGANTFDGYEDFIYDTRATLMEIFHPSFSEHGSGADPMPEGEQGIVVQTSLSRLRNPLVRYVTGDIGSLHPLPEAARPKLPEADWPHLRVLRLRGRDRRFSFDWDGEYIEFQSLSSLMNDTQCGILQWQIILGRMEATAESSLEVRLLCCPRNASVISEEDVVLRIKTFLHVYAGNVHRFNLVLLQSYDAFERSVTGRKIIKFIDRYN